MRKLLARDLGVVRYKQYSSFWRLLDEKLSQERVNTYIPIRIRVELENFIDCNS